MSQTHLYNKVSDRFQRHSYGTHIRLLRLGFCRTTHGIPMLLNAVKTFFVPTISTNFIRTTLDYGIPVGLTVACMASFVSVAILSTKAPGTSQRLDKVTISWRQHAARGTHLTSLGDTTILKLYALNHSYQPSQEYQPTASIPSPW